MPYQIFDSMDRPCSAVEDCETLLWGTLQALREEEEEEPLGLSYAIGRVSPDGSVTFEFTLHDHFSLMG